MLIITRSPWSVGAVGSLVSAGLAGSDRWPSSMSGDGMVAAPATRLHRSSIGLPAGLAHAGAVLALTQWQGRGRAPGPFGAKSGGTLRLCPLAFMWPPEPWPHLH